MGIQRTDDLDGTPAGQVTFGLDGKAYVVDLGPKENAKLHAAVQRWVTVATVYGVLPEPPEFPGYTPIGITPPQSTEAARPDMREESTSPEGGGRAASVIHEEVPEKVIRAWAIGRGHSVGPKGRIPRAIVAEYYEAH